jgi:hypothetical protein
VISDTNLILEAVQKLKSEAYQLYEFEIGKILKRIKRPIDLVASNAYLLVTVKLHHKGVVLREKKYGHEIKSKIRARAAFG